jgi:hypothetical protein
MTRCAAVCFAPAAGAFRAPLSLSLAAPDSQLRLRSDRPPAAAAIQAYVECNLMHDTATYKVPLAEGNNSEDVAMWPVTPYTLTLANHDRTTDVWATLYVDGCKISKHFIERGGSKEIEGIDDGMSTKELLFSFPRLMTSECVLRLPAERAHARAPQCQLIGPCVALLPVLSRRHDKLAKERLSQVGEIKVEATRATFLKKETRKGGGASFDRCARYSSTAASASAAATEPRVAPCSSGTARTSSRRTRRMRSSLPRTAPRGWARRSPRRLSAKGTPWARTMSTARTSS